MSGEPSTTIGEPTMPASASHPPSRAMQKEEEEEDPTLKASNDLLNGVDCSEYLAQANLQQSRADGGGSDNADGEGEGEGEGGDQQQLQQEERGHESNDLLYHLCIDQLGAETSGSPTTYSCVPSLSKDARGTLVPYDYNVHVLKAFGNIWYDTVEEVTAEMEGKMVRYLAEELGLSECAGSNRAGLRRELAPRRSLLRRRELQTDLPDGLEMTITTSSKQDAEDGNDGGDGPTSPLVGISSEPWDMIDANTECTNHNLGVPSSCYHMKGSFAAYFEPSTPQETIEAETRKILKLIMQGMKDRRFKTDAIPLTVYTGPFDSDGSGDGSSGGNGSSGNDSANADGSSGNGSNSGSSPGAIDQLNADQPSSSQPPSSSGSMSSMTLAAIGAGVAVVALLIVAVLIRRRRRLRRTNYKDRSADNSFDDRSTNSSYQQDVEGNTEVIYDPTKELSSSATKEGKQGQGERPQSQATAPSDDGHGTCGDETMPTEQSGSYDLGDDLDFQVEVGAEKYLVADRNSQQRQLQQQGAQDKITVLTGNGSVARSLSTRRSFAEGTGESFADDESSIASEESGVTIELDMARVNSTISDVTWVDPNPAIINQFPPLRSLYAPNVPAINEVDSNDFDEKDEDPLVLVGSVERKSSHVTGCYSNDHTG